MPDPTSQNEDDPADGGATGSSGSTERKVMVALSTGNCTTTPSGVGEVADRVSAAVRETVRDALRHDRTHQEVADVAGAVARRVVIENLS